MWIAQGLPDLYIHERTLQLVYNYYELSSVQLLMKERSFCIHYQNIHMLMIQIFKVLNNMIDNVYNDLFDRNSHDVNL